MKDSIAWKSRFFILFVAAILMFLLAANVAFGRTNQPSNEERELGGYVPYADELSVDVLIYFQGAGWP